MLHKETVKGATFEILKDLMQEEKLQGFSLAGGTALALYLGHRLSIDLDLFTDKAFDVPNLESFLVDKYDFRGDFTEANTLKGELRGVKVDCITHNYPNVKNIVVIDGIRIYSIDDIAAMKLSVIADNGTRLKDFIDIAFLSTILSFGDMLNAYEKKYKNANRIRPIKGMSYYEDINRKEPIQLLKGQYTWLKIEKRLQEMIYSQDKVFAQFPIV